MNNRTIKFLLLCTIAVMAFSIRAETWEYLYQVNDIKVFSRPDGDLTCYKAEGVINGNIFEVMAVIADLERRPEWVKNLKFSIPIEGDIASTVILYEKYSFPWPASDRDTVTKSITKVNYQTLEIEADFFNSTHPSRPAEESSVRMPVIKGHQYFKFQSETKTYNSNSLCIDIGGMIPQWLIKIVSRDMPVNTLRDLEAQVEKTRGHYQTFIEKHKKMVSP